MLLRLSRLVFLACIFPVIAFAPFTPQRPIIAAQERTVFQLAQKEMPLPVIRVTAWPAPEGKRRFMVEMSTAGLAWAKKPVCHVVFQTRSESGEQLEEALREASAFAKSFIKAAKDNPALQTAPWY
jgi:hypothetical protein